MDRFVIYEYELCYCWCWFILASLLGIVPGVVCFIMNLYKVIVWKKFFVKILINMFESGKVKSFQAYKVIVWLMFLRIFREYNLLALL